jgi:isocitrate/isopropylmalate dehydrogenase
METKNIASILGNGIGKEVVPGTQKILKNISL